MQNCMYLFATAVMFVFPASMFADEAERSPQRWEGAIQKFEAQDKEHPPEKGGVLFIGSSSIRGWDLDQYFPDLPVMNRGFGGSEIADSTHFAPRIVWPYEPTTIVLYAGDNDIAHGKSPRQVFDDYQAFVRRVREKLPQTNIVYIAIKPSLARWETWDDMRKANRKIQAATEEDPKQEFVDIGSPMLGDDGRPRRELFQNDGLHLSPAGYKLWTSLVRPHLEQADRESK